MSVLSSPHFHDEEAAYGFAEARIWPNGRVCPHCGVVDRSGKLKGKSTRIGTYKCYACRKPFTVKVGTIFEASHVKLHIWLQAIFLLCSSKKSISSNQLHRTLGVTLKTAWFMSHRIREAMKAGSLLAPLGGEGKTVEADETFLWNKEGAPVKRGYQHKRAIAALVERGGTVRTFHVDRVDTKTLRPIVEANADRASAFMTDEAKYYRGIGRRFIDHGVVNHSSGEYVRGNAHTNTLEGYFSIFKCGMKGVYQHCDEKHLHRYLAEFDFRYNARVALGIDDQEGTARALRGIVGKRLTYRDSSPVTDA